MRPAIRVTCTSAQHLNKNCAVPAISTASTSTIFIDFKHYAEKPAIYIDFEHYTQKRWEKLWKCAWGNHMDLIMLGNTKVHKHQPDRQMANIKHALKSKAVE